jgi:glycosyltransferase involved in cell wall biosynthesis
MKKGISIIFSSHRGEQYDKEYETRLRSKIGLKSDRVEVICIPNMKQYSLAQAYNLGWERANTKDNVLLFIHNDIRIDTQNWGFKLLNILNNENFDIVGLAGTDHLADNGVWWSYRDQGRCFGIVNHTDGLREWETPFAPPLAKTKPVVVIDGLFIAVNPDNVKHRFDESFEGFHLYDLAFVFPNFLDGSDVGVTTSIRVCHESIGMVNAEWERNRIKFAEQYSEYLPYDLETDGE